METEEYVQSEPQDYPGVELAYPIAVASYEVAAKRLDAMDSRLQTLMTLVASISAILPTYANSRGVSFYSCWFYTAVGLFAIIIGLGLYGRLAGSMKVLKPSELYDGWLHLDDWEFKKEMIGFASEDFRSNLNLSERRWLITVVITFLFVLETVCLAIWVVRA